MPGPTRADNRPPYARIAAHYRDLISIGELSPGDLLPSIRSLADQWDVSTATADRAMKLLRDERLVQGIPGVGTEVMARPISLSSGAERHDRSSKTQSSWGVGEKSSGHTAGITEAPEGIAHVLGISPGDDVIRRSRVYRDGHGIVSHSTSWIPAEFARAVPELARSERLKGGLSLDLIARATGRRVVTRVDEETARIATPRDLDLLELRADTVAAILVLTATFLDADGEPLEHGVDLGAPGRTRRTTSAVQR
ncbi:GntR family transcriptional regulator [Streptomyces clavuligerus]|uniref:GntR family transcriptional regulator n=1 Tax=Streptomyces clavuligerus TaxID=1901 RepID=UPI00017FF4B7|nr:GntR family transcriptional regulator [Streptomyces clavuligerus]AXU16815.1 GntR family transcriptional regulator [Streptomyces clavuligerus]EDY48776.1 GntR-family transcriptional regulator [Streptomyces clavuligerus]MBY6300949.1 GntR family transcriptional regulator [Streptomyces clavuligerus]QPJ97038.1 GntR family transcriptional regulator [Streptomyces clavuligerus]WDN55760.1 GntR family transcriptional regulator [Streptomyces clavuligerus]